MGATKTRLGISCPRMVIGENSLLMILLAFSKNTGPWSTASAGCVGDGAFHKKTSADAEEFIKTEIPCNRERPRIISQSAEILIGNVVGQKNKSPVF